MDDPLKNLPEAEQVLFEAFAREANGKPHNAVMGASINMIVNALRQIYNRRRDAEAKFDELFGNAKEMLLTAHYDSVTGVRRNVFPHTQVIRPSLHVDEDFFGPGIKRPGGNGK